MKRPDHGPRRHNRRTAREGCSSRAERHHGGGSSAGRAPECGSGGHGFEPRPSPLARPCPGGGTADSPASEAGGRSGIEGSNPSQGTLRGSCGGCGGQPAEMMKKADRCPPFPVHFPRSVSAPVAQRTRAPDYESGGPRFESWRGHLRDVAQLAERPLWEREVRGSSPRVSTVGDRGDVAQPGQGTGFGTRGPRFDSAHPDCWMMEGWQSWPIARGC